MTTYTSRPAQVEAVHYAADASNLDELTGFIEAAGMVATPQSPWNPEDGQSCVQVRAKDAGPLDMPVLLVVPGGYVADYATGLVAYSAADFEALYDVTEAPAPVDDSTPAQPE